MLFFFLENFHLLFSSFLSESQECDVTKKNCDFFHLNNKKEKKPPNVNYVLLVDVPIRRYDLAVRSGEKHFCLQGHQTALFSNLVFFFQYAEVRPCEARRNVIHDPWVVDERRPEM